MSWVTAFCLAALVVPTAAQAGAMDDVMIECAEADAHHLNVSCDIEGWLTNTLTLWGAGGKWGGERMKERYASLISRFFDAGGDRARITFSEGGRKFVKTGKPAGTGISWSDWEAD